MCLRNRGIGLRAIAVAASLAFVFACSTSVFDDIQDRAWSDSNGAERIESEEFGAQVLGIEHGDEGAAIAVLGLSPVGVEVLRYDAGGGLVRRGFDFSQVNPDNARPFLAAASDRAGLVALGGLGDLDTVFVVNALDDNATPTSLGAMTCGQQGSNLGEKLVFANTDLGETDEVDLIAIRGKEIFIFIDVASEAVPSCVRCNLNEFESVGDLLAFDFAGNAGPVIDDEILISVDSTLYAFTGSHVQAQTLTEGVDGCFENRTPLLTAQVPSGAKTGFGAQLALGDADGDGNVDVAASNQDEVIVMLNFDQSNPPGAPASQKFAITRPPDTGAFGSGPMTFADIVPNPPENDQAPERDELIVGDPTASPEGVPSAGQALVFAFSPEDEEYELRERLYDSDPTGGQSYGRSLSTVEFNLDDDDVDTLAVGAKEEVFYLFRIVREGSDPRN